MVDDIDIWRAARLLLRQHGYDAPVIAAQRRDALLADGDIDGILVWKRIIFAIKELMRARDHGERVN